MDIRQRKLKRIVKYIPETGEFIGGNSINFFSRGYLRMSIKGKAYSLQRLAWIYHYGKIPDNGRIGFKDKDKTNLKIDNLYIMGTLDNDGVVIEKRSVKFVNGKWVKVEV